MKNHYGISKAAIALFLGMALAAVFFTIASIPAASQSGKPTPMKDGHPDLNGFWAAAPTAAQTGLDPNTQVFQRTADGSILFDISLSQGSRPLCVGDACQNPNQPSYTPAYLPRVRAIAKSEFAGTTPEDPILSCKPAGVPRTAINGVQILQTPQVTAILHGDYTDRIIYTDGRPHPKDMEPSYMGNSIGHWEGNTLVVDVAGLNDDTWLGGGIGGFNIYTSVHSDKEHVVERWTREGDDITYEATVDDPVALTKPWVIAPRKIRISTDPEDYLNTYFCDGSGINEALKEHYVKPNPEDRDIKNKCDGHHCEPGQFTSSAPAK